MQQSYKTASGNHCCNNLDDYDYRRLYVTKPQAVITVATAPLETLAWSGSLGTLWQTKLTFTIIHLKNAFFNVFPQRPALKTLITQGLHKFGKPPQPLCLHTLQKRTTLKLQKARSRDVKIASTKQVRQTAALSLPITSPLYSTHLLFVKKKNRHTKKGRHLRGSPAS